MAVKRNIMIMLMMLIAVTSAQRICTSELAGYIQNVTSRSSLALNTFALTASAVFPQPYPQPTEVVELYSSQSEKLVIPASNTKLFTTAAAFIKYGENYTFTTNVVGDLPNQNVTPAVESWTSLGNGPTNGRMYAKAVYTSADAKMWYFGGLEASGTRRNDLWTYDTNNNVWTSITATGSIPSARYAHGQVLSQDETKIFVYGGSSTAGRLNDLYQYDITTNVWTAFTPSAPLPEIRTLSCGVATRFNTLLFFGGSQGTAKFFNDIWQFNLNTNQWTLISPSGPIPTPRSGSTCLLDGDDMLIFGGHISGTTKVNDVLRFNTVTNTWVAVPAPTSGDTPIARTTHAAVMTSERVMVIFGGTNGNDLAALQKYDVANNVWSTPILSGATPAARDSAVLVYNPVKSQIFSYGGTNGNAVNYINDFWVYNYFNNSLVNPTLPSISNTMCLLASGDPTLTTNKLQSFMAQLSLQGVKTVQNFYLDTSVYSDFNAEENADWVVSDLSYYYGAPAGALILNKNTFSLTVTGGANLNAAPTISVSSSENGAVPIINQVVTGTTTSISTRYIPGTNGLTVFGTIAVGATYTTTASTWPGAAHFAQVLRNVAKLANVNMTNVVVGKCPLSSNAPTVYSFTSSSMGSILADCLTNSDNMVAEALLRKLGADSGKTSGKTVDNGLAEVKRILGAAFPGKINLNQTFLVDGSGLSSTNYVTVKSISQLLLAINTLPNAKTFKSYLPVAGQTGTLDSAAYGRFASPAPGRGVIKAKTGTLAVASALSGYVRSECSEPEIVFSLVLNTPASFSGTTAKQTLDDVANILARWENC